MKKSCNSCSSCLNCAAEKARLWVEKGADVVSKQADELELGHCSASQLFSWARILPPLI